MKNNLLASNRLMALSRLFHYPDQWPGARDLDLLAAGGTKEAGMIHSEGLASLQADYVRLFVNALPEVSCPPYGSFYLEGTLMGTSTVGLNRLYAEYGFQADELADHIAVELEFLALLATLAADGAVRQDYDFLVDHMGRWTPEFFARLKQNDAGGFYGRIARVAEALLLCRQAGPAPDAINADPNRQPVTGGRYPA